MYSFLRRGMNVRRHERAERGNVAVPGEALLGDALGHVDLAEVCSGERPRTPPPPGVIPRRSRSVTHGDDSPSRCSWSYRQTWRKRSFTAGITPFQVRGSCPSQATRPPSRRRRARSASGISASTFLSMTRIALSLRLESGARQVPEISRRGSSGASPLRRQSSRGERGLGFRHQPAAPDGEHLAARPSREVRAEGLAPALLQAWEQFVGRAAERSSAGAPEAARARWRSGSPRRGQASGRFAGPSGTRPGVRIAPPV